MKHISILVPEGDSSLSNLEATFKMFNMTNSALQRAGKAPMFATHLVGTQKTARSSNGMFNIIPNTTIEDIKKTDLIIIPAIHGDYREVVSKKQCTYSLDQNAIPQWCRSGESVYWCIYIGGYRFARWKRVRHALAGSK